MDNQQCTGCGRPIGTGIASGLCVYCSVNGQIRNESTELARLRRLNAVMEEELRTKTQALFDLESEVKVLKDIDAHRQPHLEAVQQDFYKERDRRLELNNLLDDIASVYQQCRNGQASPELLLDTIQGALIAKEKA